MIPNEKFSNLPIGTKLVVGPIRIYGMVAQHHFVEGSTVVIESPPEAYTGLDDAERTQYICSGISATHGRPIQQILDNDDVAEILPAE